MHKSEKSNTRKRVSFGGHGSTLETLIVEDIDFDQVSENEKNFYQQHLLLSQSSSSTDNVRTVDLPVSIIRTSRSRNNSETCAFENPFLADGELSQKADYIISHSRISRTDLHIVDPDMIHGGGFTSDQKILSADKTTDTKTAIRGSDDTSFRNYGTPNSTHNYGTPNSTHDFPADNSAGVSVNCPNGSAMLREDTGCATSTDNRGNDSKVNVPTQTGAPTQISNAKNTRQQSTHSTAPENSTAPEHSTSNGTTGNNCSDHPSPKTGRVDLGATPQCEQAERIKLTAIKIKKPKRIKSCCAAQ